MGINHSLEAGFQFSETWETINYAKQKYTDNIFDNRRCLSICQTVFEQLVYILRIVIVNVDLRRVSLRKNMSSLQEYVISFEEILAHFDKILLLADQNNMAAYKEKILNYDMKINGTNTMDRNILEHYEKMFEMLHSSCKFIHSKSSSRTVLKNIIDEISTYTSDCKTNLIIFFIRDFYRLQASPVTVGSLLKHVPVVGVFFENLEENSKKNSESAIQSSIQAILNSELRGVSGEPSSSSSYTEPENAAMSGSPNTSLTKRSVDEDDGGPPRKRLNDSTEEMS